MNAVEAVRGTVEEVKQMPRAVNVEWEIGAIADAANGVRLLADALRHDSLPNDRECRVAQSGIAAMAALVVARLTDLRRALGGEFDPWTLLADHNSTDGDDDHDLPGLVLHPWPPERKIEEGHRLVAFGRRQMQGRRRSTGTPRGRAPRRVRRPKRTGGHRE